MIIKKEKRKRHHMVHHLSAPLNVHSLEESQAL